VYGYVVMPEHVHMLVSEPERGTLAKAMQSLNQGVARRLALRAAAIHRKSPPKRSLNGAPSRVEVRLAPREGNWLRNLMQGAVAG
jgi:REP element-mobilizing transposase RayT